MSDYYYDNLKRGYLFDVGDVLLN
jgi:hypothetical protein